MFSMAGVAEILCKYGAGDKVLQLRQFDPFGFSEYYGVTELFDDLYDLLKRTEQLVDKYDKIVIHDYCEFRTYFPKKKVILVFHGTKLREMSDDEKRALEGYQCFVTTDDLLSLLPNSIHLPAPIDYDLFQKTDLPKEESWIALNRGYQREHIEPQIMEKYPKTQYYERNNTNLVNYKDMPKFLSNYTDYVDMKYTYDKPNPKVTTFLSCTALQALALGLRVWNVLGQVENRELNLILHEPNKVVREFLDKID